LMVEHLKALIILCPENRFWHVAPPLYERKARNLPKDRSPHHTSSTRKQNGTNGVNQAPQVTGPHDIDCFT